MTRIGYLTNMIKTNVCFFVMMFLLSASPIPGVSSASQPTSAEEIFTNLKQDFLNPPNVYRLVQYQLNDHTLTKYPNYGIGGTMAFFYQELYQRGDEGPLTIGPLVDAAVEQGFQVWLADDFGYPSGMAGGKVVEDNPEYEVRGLARLVHEGQGEIPLTVPLPDGAESFVYALLYPVVDGVPDFMQAIPQEVELQQVLVSGHAGDWRLDTFVRVIRDNDVQAQSTIQQFGHSGRYPDLMNHAAMERFLAHMHAPMLAQIESPALKVKGFYTNEPNLMQLHWSAEATPFACLPWNNQLPDAFKDMHGYELMSRLGMLFEGDFLEARRTRMHFHQTVAELLTNSFARQIADWCAARGIVSSGHFLLNEYLSMHVACYGDLMKFASDFHVPALDIGIPNPEQFASFPYQQTRFFSSIASWKKRERVILLLDPIIAGGGLQRLSPAMPLLYNATNMGFFHGANLFTSYLPLDARADGSATGYTEEEFTAFNEYIGRIALMLRGVRRETSIALYYPIAMFQSEYKPKAERWPQVVAYHTERQNAWDQIEKTLLDADLDYVIVHPDAVANADIQDGMLRIGRGAFRYLIMPQMEMLPGSVLRQIQRFEDGGGVVIWVDRVPEAGAYVEEDSITIQAMVAVTPVNAASLPEELSTPYDPAFDLKFDTETNDMPVARFWRDGKCVYYLVNRSGAALEVDVTGDTVKHIQVLDPVDGMILDKELPVSLKIEAHNSILILD